MVLGSQVFAPLAKLLGVYCIKEELEELSLRYAKPEVYTHLKRWQERQSRAEQAVVASARQDLQVRGLGFMLLRSVHSSSIV